MYRHTIAMMQQRIVHQQPPGQLGIAAGLKIEIDQADGWIAVAEDEVD
jgi:hypothetical protein